MQPRSRGFTLLELMTVVAIIAILGAVAVIGYQKYTARAQGADIIEKYDAIRTGVNAKALSDKVDDCAALVSALGNSNLSSDYAGLTYGFEAVKDGYRPVLKVCAQLEPAKPLAVKVAREAHDVLARNGVVEKNAVVTDSVVSFALRLTQGDAALCKIAPAQPAAACGQAPVVAQAVVPVQPAQPAQLAASTSAACPDGQERVSGYCVSKCASGLTRNGSGTCVRPPDPVQVVVTPRLNQPPPVPVAATVTTCPAGQEWITVITNGTPSKACGAPCQAGERRNDAGLCFKDTPPTPPAWAVANPIPSSLPIAAPPGRLPTCGDGTKLFAAFVGGVLTNTCVKECAAGESLDPVGQCVSVCPGGQKWDQSLRSCIDPANPPACPSGLTRNSEGTCGCPDPEQTLLPDGSCRLPCSDTYGPTCDLDFGKGMCGEAFVQEMCRKFCSGCTGSWVTPFPETRGEGTKPTMPYFPPEMAHIMPRTGETLVLDDQVLARIYGVTSPDGTPISVTSLTIQGKGADLWTAERRADGRWVIRVTGDTERVLSSGVSRYGPYTTTPCSNVVVMELTFTNASGSTVAGTSYSWCRR